MEKLFKTKVSLYLRAEPNKSAAGTLMPVGATVKCVESLKGELVDGIDDWYKNEVGLYFWAGGVEEIKSEELKLSWPLEQVYKKITTPFSEIWILNQKKKHTGIDIAAPVGAVIYAADNCIVKRVGFLDANRTMAQYVGVEHTLSGFCTTYLHIDPLVKVGDSLKARDIIGHTAQLIGMGSHLHFNVWKGSYDNDICPRGALPMIEYVGEITPVSDPAFPGNFIDPMSISYV